MERIEDFFLSNVVYRLMMQNEVNANRIDSRGSTIVRPLSIIMNAINLSGIIIKFCVLVIRRSSVH